MRAPEGLPDRSALEAIRTPALLLDVDRLASNLATLLRLVDGNPERLRPHVKTAKLAYTMGRMIDRGIRNFKCATTLELRTLCELGATDVLVAYPARGANARRVLRIAEEFPKTEVSVLAEDAGQLAPWAGGPVGLFVDVNPGMDRTGIPQERSDEILRLWRAADCSGARLRGLHYYDGHLGGKTEAERRRAAHAGYDRLLELAAELARFGKPPEELVTAGTPTLVCSLTYPGFAGVETTHRVSPGTLVYGDLTSAAQLPEIEGFAPAAFVLSTIVSRPRPGIVTCDAGHKSVSADAGVPTCGVLGFPDWRALTPSEEHLPIAVAEERSVPELGSTLLLVPRHVCPTVNNFDHAVLFGQGRILGLESVTARGRERPLDLSRPR